MADKQQDDILYLGWVASENRCYFVTHPSKSGKSGGVAIPCPHGPHALSRFLGHAVTGGDDGGDIKWVVRFLGTFRTPTRFHIFVKQLINASGGL